MSFDILYTFDDSQETIEFLEFIINRQNNKTYSVYTPITQPLIPKENDLTPEEIFIQLAELSYADMYNRTIIVNYLNKLEIFLIKHVPKRFRKIELIRWKDNFIDLGYTKNDTLIFNWIEYGIIHYSE